MKKTFKFIGELLFEVVKIVGLSFIFVFIITKFLLFPCSVDGSSMYPTLEDKEVGYSLVVTKLIGINRFDIVVIDQGEKLLVKRVIALPGETIEYKNNVLYIDDVEYEEPYLSDVTTEDFKVELNNNEYYCLGDNRNVSKDSRFYGPFNYEDFKASHLLVLFPFSNFRFVK